MKEGWREGKRISVKKRTKNEMKNVYEERKERKITFKK